MPLFTQYTKPGVYTTVIYEDAGISLFGDARIPVLIGEGQESRRLSNIELHRGSSNVSDEQKVLENLSHQITGVGRTYKLTYAPVVKGNGKGEVSTNPSDLQAYTTDSQGVLIPIRITYLDGVTGIFMTQDILPPEAELKVTYFFKRKDTPVTDDLTDQVPSFARFTGQTGMVISLERPGYMGNTVRLAFTIATVGAGVKDALAITGVGSNDLSIELRNDDIGSTVRTLSQIKDLIEVGIPTKDAGILTVLSVDSAVAGNPGTAVAPTKFLGGSGQSTNKSYKLKNSPVVDGSDGGVVTNLPRSIRVTVNNFPVQVQALDGRNGVFTLMEGIPAGSLLKVDYFTNNYQDTYDELPAENVIQVLTAGYAPGRDDFVDTVDYVLVDNKINWGACVLVKQAKYTPGYQPFDASVVGTTLVDERMYLRPCQGPVDGVNVIFNLEDVPTDGSGLARATDNPDLIRVYYGSDPVQARSHPVCKVIRLNGKIRSFTLQNPPPAGQAVWATYFRNTLNDHQFTLEVATPGICGQGTYIVKDERGNRASVITNITESTDVMEADFSNTGVIWPYSDSGVQGQPSVPDLRGVCGQTPHEVITFTFQDDNLSMIVTPAVQATTQSAQDGLRFRATLTGVGPNGITPDKPTVRMISATPCSDAAAIQVMVEAIEININREDPADPGQPHPTNPTRSLQDIINMVTAGNYVTPLLGKLLCEASGTVIDLNSLCVSGVATHFSGGAAAEINPYSVRYKVSSSRTLGDALQDRMGRTGNATTNPDPHIVPTFGNDTEGNDGYLGQTYNDIDTGFTTTIVDPNDALDYGYTQLPSPSYRFRPGDKLVFKSDLSSAHRTSVIPTLAIYGLSLKVTTTYGMFTGDQVFVNTYNKAGAEPSIGEYYYVNLLQGKLDKDFDLRYYTSTSDIFHEYGDPITENRLSLAAKLMFQNGANLIACKQVRKETGLETSSDQAYMDAIADLAKALPGSDRKCDVIIPMSTSVVVQQFLGKHLNTQAAPRNCGEAIGFIGMPMYATPEQARSIARSISSERVIMVYPGGAILSIDINNRSTEFAVDGCFLAAAMCGLYLNPSNDVATTLTTQKLVGFSRLIKRTAEPILDLMAADGVCLLIERDGAFEIRHYMTTSTDNILKREPTTTTIVDYTRQRMRKVLRQFIGRKSVQAVLTDIAVTANALLRALIEQEILETFKGMQVTRDEFDPTVVHLTVTIKPIFSILWIDVTFRVTIRG